MQRAFQIPSLSVSGPVSKPDPVPGGSDDSDALPVTDLGGSAVPDLVPVQVPVTDPGVGSADPDPVALTDPGGSPESDADPATGSVAHPAHIAPPPDSTLDISAPAHSTLDAAPPPDYAMDAAPPRASLLVLVLLCLLLSPLAMPSTTFPSYTRWRA